MRTVSTFVIGGVVTFCPIPAPRHRRRIAEIPAVDVINVTIPVIVNAVIGNFVGVLPELRAELRMLAVYPAIYDSDDDFRRSLLNCPRLWQIERAQIPLLFITGLSRLNLFIRSRAKSVESVKLNGFNPRIVFISFAQLFQARTGGRVYRMKPNQITPPKKRMLPCTRIR